MGAVPSLPPYAHVTKEAVLCAAQASLRFNVPELLLDAIIGKEDGRTGQCTKNKDGSYDCGLAQINTSWAPLFKKSNVSFYYVTNDVCTNLQACAYILRDNYNKKGGDWRAAIVAYNIGPNSTSVTKREIGAKYAADVIQRWWGFQNWVSHYQPASQNDTPSKNSQLIFSP
jgi:soluble lytic murein transglycosylase-like protein